ncbi:unnamed protein product [Camellia sinensis]
MRKIKNIDRNQRRRETVKSILINTSHPFFFYFFNPTSSLSLSERQWRIFNSSEGIWITHACICHHVLHFLFLSSFPILQLILFLFPFFHTLSCSHQGTCFNSYFFFFLFFTHSAVPTRAHVFAINILLLLIKKKKKKNRTEIMLFLTPFTFFIYLFFKQHLLPTPFHTFLLFFYITIMHHTINTMCCFHPLFFLSYY